MERCPGAGFRAQHGIQNGFTLVELLVVILIIGILASLMSVVVTKARQKGKQAEVANDLNSFRLALHTYKTDEGTYPGYELQWDGVDEHFNAFPVLFEALLGDPRPKGLGGRNSPYWEDAKEDKMVVLDDPADPTGDHRVVTRDERYDQHVPKYYLDAWGTPYVYRENESKTRETWMHKPKSYDIWSVGPNGKNQSLWEVYKPNERLEGGEAYDDIGNWQ